jgi:hypothetical protein
MFALKNTNYCPRHTPIERDPDALKSGSWDDGTNFFGEGEFFADSFGAIKDKFGYEE